MDPPVAGQETEVGFTIRQHGVTPVDLEDVAVAITGPSGAIAVFDAAAGRHDGPLRRDCGLRGGPVDVGDPPGLVRGAAARCHRRRSDRLSGVLRPPSSHRRRTAGRHRLEPSCPSPRSCSREWRSPTRCQVAGGRNRRASDEDGRRRRDRRGHPRRPRRSSDGTRSRHLRRRRHPERRSPARHCSKQRAARRVTPAPTARRCSWSSPTSRTRPRSRAIAGRG